MKIQIKIITLFTLLLFAIRLNLNSQESKTSFIWPIDSEKIELKLSSLFGESRGDHFHNGVDISSDNEKILSIADGEILYSRYSSDNPYENDHGSGNSVWVLHNKKYVSAYFHLKDGRELNLLKSKAIQQKAVLGKSGNTGHSSGSHLHFIVINESEKKTINPLSILPEVKDSTLPNIGSLILTIGTSKTYIRDGDTFNNSSKFPITVEIFDGGERKSQRRGIKELEILFNQQSIKKASFNWLYLENGKWKNESGFSFEELYFENNYYLGDLSFHSGSNTIEIKVKDFNNNSSKKNFEFMVNKIQPKDK